MTNIVAEIGCNHQGNVDLAVEMIKIAKHYCKVDCVKFQKRCVKELLSEDEYNKPYDNPNSFGKTYGEHRDFLEFDLDKHKYLKNVCDNEGIIYSSSVWDLTSAKEITTLNPEYIKVPSASNLVFDIYEYLFDNYSGDIHVSLGMTTKDEEKRIYDYFKKNNKLKNLIFYSCTSAYPVDFKDVCILEIERLKKEYSDIKSIGFSGHHLGISIDIVAALLGVSFIERHFTLDRTNKGTDNPASLEPDGLKKLVRNLEVLKPCLRFKDVDILDIEINSRKKLKRNI